MNLYTAAVTIFLVLDAPGNVPIFISALQHVDPKRRLRIIIRESIFALITLAIFLFAGHSIIEGLQLSGPALSISGGIILFLIAIRFIFPPDKKKEVEAVGEPFLVPLAIPLFAGPASMAVVMLMAEQNPKGTTFIFFALLIAWALSTIILMLSTPISNWLGPRGISAVERLTGMILTTVAVQMLLTGVSQFFHF